MNEAMILKRVSDIFSALLEGTPKEDSEIFGFHCDVGMNWLISQMYKKNLKVFEVIPPEKSGLDIRSKQMNQLPRLVNKHFISQRIYSRKTTFSKMVTPELVSAFLRALALAKARKQEPHRVVTSEESLYIRSELECLCALAGYEKQLVE